MTITIDDPILEERLQSSSEAIGQTPEEFVLGVVRDRLGEAAAPPRPFDMEKILATIHRVASMPVLDTRSAEEIIGYNEHGLFD